MSNSVETSDETGAGALPPGWFSAAELGDGRFRLVGELDGVAVAAVRERLGCLGGDVEFDCSQVSFIDSSGLHLLVGIRDACTAGGGSLVLVNPSRCVARLVALTGLDAVLVTRVDGPSQS
jgi:anti-anti-sigma factor